MINPDRTDIIWNEVWENETETDQEKLFSHILFLEGYEVFKKYFISQHTKVLEAGGGSGRYGIKIGVDFPQTEVTVIDIAPASLKVGRKIAQDAGAFNVLFKQDDALNLSFKDNSFDMIISDAVIQVLPRYEKAVKEMARVVKPGGLLIIAVCNKYNFHSLYKWYLKIIKKPYEYGFEKSFSSKELKQLVKQEGLSVVATDGFSCHYGLRRQQNVICRAIGKIVQLVESFTGKWTNRFISRKFGFETVIVAKKEIKRS